MKNIFSKIFNFFSKFVLEIVVIFFCIFLDQISKYIIVKIFDLYESIPIIDKIFNLTYIKNTGVAFGVMQNRNIFILLFIFLIVSFYYFFIKDDFKKFYIDNKENIFFRISIGFLIGGAFGNLTDRIFRGAVVDFLDFQIWPVFNLADSFICLSIAYFIYFLIFKNRTKIF